MRCHKTSSHSSLNCRHKSLNVADRRCKCQFSLNICRWQDCGSYDRPAAVGILDVASKQLRFKRKVKFLATSLRLFLFLQIGRWQGGRIFCSRGVRQVADGAQGDFSSAIETSRVYNNRPVTARN